MFCCQGSFLVCLAGSREGSKQHGSHEHEGTQSGHSHTIGVVIAQIANKVWADNSTWVKQALIVSIYSPGSSNLLRTAECKP